MRWLVDVYMQSEVAVTYKVRDGIPVVPTEQLACHVEGDDIAKREREKRNGETSGQRQTLRREVATQLIWAVVEEAWVCQWCRRHHVPCC